MANNHIETTGGNDKPRNQFDDNGDLVRRSGRPTDGKRCATYEWEKPNVLTRLRNAADRAAIIKCTIKAQEYNGVVDLVDVMSICDELSEGLRGLIDDLSDKSVLIHRFVPMDRGEDN